MKVCLISPPSPNLAYHVGGTSPLYRWLSEQGINFCTLELRDPVTKTSRAFNAFLDFFDFIPSPYNLFHDPLERVGLCSIRSSIKKLTKRNPDIILGSTYWALLTGLFYKFRVKKTPVIHLDHGGCSLQKLPLTVFCDRVITFNPLMKKRYENFGVHACMIPNPVDVDKFRPDINNKKVRTIRKRLEINRDRPMIFAVGVHRSIKGFDRLIKAAALLEKENVHVVIGGKGPKTEEWRLFGKKLLGERCHFVGYIPDLELPDYYIACDVYSQPSSWEGMSVTELEAMACNCRIVVHNHPNLIWPLGNAGISVNTYDIRAYAEALKRALETDFGDLPRKRALEFSLDKIGRKYIDLFNELLNKT